ncbi:MAG: GNAT family N-acetyltransferase [Eubacteriales bacterium]|nr:GNAT family N-acetyltransferase [Eubacteriales bacterium]
MFYDTVHTVNAADYTPAQLDAWAPRRIDADAWARSLSAHFTVVAETDGVISGFGDIDAGGYLDRLYVHRNYQRRGIASGIAERLERYAVRCGAARISTHASFTARPFFEKRGYRVLRENTVIRHGTALTNFIMEKDAAPASTACTARR